MPLPTPTAYGWLMLAGILVSLAFWSRLAKRDERLFIVYLAGLMGAFVGAKIVYLLAEGWMFRNDPQRWVIWATGKTILGALLGGYLSVELVKKLTGYTKPTGDWFAMIAPLGIAIGRIGCLLHGCCLGVACEPAWWTRTDAQGVARLPAVPIEIGFNLGMIALFFLLRRRHLLAGQHFHLYLMAYGLFRFAHEFYRASPRCGGGFSNYQIPALACFALGLGGFIRRQRQTLRLPRRDDGLSADPESSRDLSS